MRYGFGVGIPGPVSSSGVVGEIGHIIVNKKEPEACTCCKYGCVEQYCSPTGIVRVAKRVLSASKGSSVLRNKRLFDYHEVLSAAAGGDKVAKEIMDKVYDYTGHALAAACCVTNPDTIVLGGEFCRIGQSAMDGIAKAFGRYVYRAKEKVRFRFAALDQDATIYGAFRLVYDTFR